MAHLHALPDLPADRMRRIGMVDLDTGEVVPGVPTLHRQRVPRYITEDYQLMFSSAIAAATEDKDLGQQEWRVLMRLISILGVGDDNRWGSVNLSDLGKMLDMQRPNVSAAMKTLVKKGIIIKGVRIGRGHAYSLNPMFGWKGPAAQWPEAALKAPKMRLLKGGKTDSTPAPATPSRRADDAKVEQILIESGAPSLLDNLA